MCEHKMLLLTFYGTFPTSPPGLKFQENVPRVDDSKQKLGFPLWNYPHVLPPACCTQTPQNIPELFPAFCERFCFGQTPDAFVMCKMQTPENFPSNVHV